MDYAELAVLGAVAGFTIFLGLPVALLGVKERTKGFLNALAVGILIFLIVDVLSHAWDTTTEVVKSAAQGTGSMADAATYLALVFGGLALGLLGLLVYERRYMGSGGQGATPWKMSTMIALGIGAHNLSEGLAIGQAYLAGQIGLNKGLAVVLVVGFAAHNSTEGFGIIAPLSGASPRPAASFLARVLFIGGAPTLLGTLLGGISYSQTAYVFFLALAGGALVYVTMMMFNTGRRQHGSDLMMAGIFIGLCAGLATDLIVSIGGA
jgi:ZIP family zinc transporter